MSIKPDMLLAVDKKAADPASKGIIYVQNLKFVKQSPMVKEIKPFSVQTHLI